MSKVYPIKLTELTKKKKKHSGKTQAALLFLQCVVHAGRRQRCAVQSPTKERINQLFHIQ